MQKMPAGLVVSSRHYPLSLGPYGSVSITSLTASSIASSKSPFDFISSVLRFKCTLLLVDVELAFQTVSPVFALRNAQLTETVTGA